MKKKNIDRKEKLKKIGKIGLTIFNVLTGIWFFISFICIIIAACSGSLTTSGNNNGGGNRIISKVSSSLEGNVSEVARTKYETRENSGVYDEHTINNDYSISGIENYNSNYILTNYDDVDITRQYHIYTSENYIQYALTSIGHSIKSYMLPGQNVYYYFELNPSDYVPYPGNASYSVIGLTLHLYTDSNNLHNVDLLLRRIFVSTSTKSDAEIYRYSFSYSNSFVYTSNFEEVGGESRHNAFYALVNGKTLFPSFDGYTLNEDSLKLFIYYFSEYSVHDVGVYFNYGSLTGNFSYLFPYEHYVNANNVFQYSGSDTSFLGQYEYQYIPGAYKVGTSSKIYPYMYIQYMRLTTFLYDMETRQQIYNATGTGYYIYVPYAIGLCNYNYYVYDLPSTEKVEVVRLCKSFSSGYLLGVDKSDNISSLIILSIDGNYIPSYPRGLTIYSTLFYDLKSQCAFVNGFYFYIDPNGNVHTGLTGAATGGDISNSYIGDVFKLVNQILTSFTGLFGYYLLPGISIGLLLALPLIFTIILFVVKLFKR